MRTKDIREMSNEELEKKITDLKNDLMKDKAQVSSGAPPKSPALIRNRRRDIARMKTILNQRKGGA